ncbi:Uncharacterised protein [Mycobacteroides abscessus subsp. bolletii]|uniref:DUF7374 family protein n=1 Tax=Mycobacteroides abscessus TaxID=36809 RepID=UPI000927AE8A|nr:hypothetical protein [Mycobacteroides abscessus]SHQ63009.1 Uncharacterised protein [Mycobacteroides abscessus subsp. bolletii]SHS46644.1 Uncharacterised protein [Mycobacteroides abscessus subsp. bolletii]SHT08230.1 Uncharacterised protein [Mycobacteroides abscessus subsp. bolletii]SHT13601.1 Uncharacterised protein [Mycobacteroides abscessus subsp. bolletii]SHY51264.1 Uncharacterised protein [Mycobacteroides abscessus subsp. bolletii]
MSVCPYCEHPWDIHDERYLDSRQCRDCGCLWRNPADIPPPPPPPTEQDELVANIEDVIWTALELQAEQGIGPYIDRDMDMVDASGAGLDMTAVAAAVAAIFVISKVPLDADGQNPG